uniref:Molecular chaperone DnaJ n=1 Tax=Streptomyces sp. NBC_01393 TaxID=2903851 RepID=A0AAU3HV38_9ACTN
MPQHVRNMPVCRDCDGFATAAITTGGRNRDGSRTTLRIACPACKGTGTVRRVRRLAVSV